MTVLHIDSGREMRGGQHQVKLLLELQQRAEVEACALARPQSPLFTHLQQAGFQVYPLTLLNVFNKARIADLVHVHDARAHSMAAMASTRPIIVSRRVAFPIGRGILSRWKYRRAARFLAVSEFVAKQLRAAGVPPEKTSVVYDAVEGRAEGTWDRTASAIALASLDPQKGRDLLHEIGDETGIPIHFSTDLPADFKRASMFVYITQSEGLGSAAILAMRMGIPVVASRVGGLAEVFEHERSGLYVSNDREAVASAMRRIVSDEHFTNEMITAAKRRAQAMFSPERMLEATLSAYERALAR